MLVSVGIPIYNRIDGFERALKSIMAQSHTDLEILLSNDHSPNPQIDELARKYAAQDSRIQYVYQEISLKTVANFSYLKNRAKGNYFMWVADDDWIDADYIEKTVAFLETHPEYSLAVGKTCYHQDANTILHSHTSFSIEQPTYLSRLWNYYRTVSLNGYYYGLFRTEMIQALPMPNQMGFDWILVAYVAFQGKIKTLTNTASHLSKGGMSNEGAGLSSYFEKQNYFTRNFLGFTTSWNCAKHIMDSPLYKIGKVAKWNLGILVFLAAYSNTLAWDLLYLKRRTLIFLKISKHGTLAKPK